MSFFKKLFTVKPKSGAGTTRISESTTKLVGVPLSAVYGRTMVRGNLVRRSVVYNASWVDSTIALCWGPVQFDLDTIRVNNKRPHFINGVLNPNRNLDPGYIDKCSVQTITGALGEPIVVEPSGAITWNSYNRVACLRVNAPASDKFSDVDSVEVVVVRPNLFTANDLSGHYSTPIPAGIPEMRSGNPVAAGLDWLLNTDYGAGLNPARFNIDAWAAAMHLCNADVAGEPRWSVNGEFGTDEGEGHADIVERILQAATAQPYTVGGKVSVFVPRPKPIVAYLDKSTFIPNGGSTSDASDVSNVITVTYSDPASFEERQVRWENPDAIAKWGEIREEIDLRAITSRVQASRLASYEGRRRVGEDIRLSGVADQRFMGLEPGDLVAVTVGDADKDWFVNKPFWVISTNPENKDGDVEVELVEYAGDSLYDDNAADVLDTNDPIFAGDPSLALPDPRQVPAPVTSISHRLGSIDRNGVLQFYVELTWAAPAQPSYMQADYVVYRTFGGDPLVWTAIGTVTGSTLTFTDYNAEIHMREHHYRVLARTSARVEGDLALAAQTSVAQQTPISPTNIQFAPVVATTPSGAVISLDVTWDMPGDSTNYTYIVEYRHNGSAWFRLGETTQRTARIPGVVSGEYEVRITPGNALGIPGLPAVKSYRIDDTNLVALSAVTNLRVSETGTASFTGPDINLVWDITYPGLAVNQWPPQVYLQYMIRVYDTTTGSLLRTEFTGERAYSYTMAKNKADGGPRRTVRITVVPADRLAREGILAQVIPTNPAPALPTAVVVKGEFRAVSLRFTPDPAADVAGMLVWMSETSGFTPSDANRVADAVDIPVFIPAASGKTFYLRYTNYDTFGPYLLNVSAETQVSTVGIDHDDLIGQIISNGNLLPELSERIDKIDLPTTGLIDRVGGLLTDIQDLETQVTTETSTRQGQYDALSSRIDTVAAKTGAQTFRQPAPPTTGMNAGDLWFDSDDANKPYRYSGTAWVATEDTRVAQALAAVQTETQARTDADTALSTQVTNLTATVNNDRTNAAAAVQSEATARAAGDTALGQRIDTIVAQGAVGFNAAAAWHFDNASAEGWTATNGALTTQANGAVRQTATTTDPYLTSPAGLTVAGSQNRLVKARITRVAGSGWDGRVYWATASHTTRSASYYKQVANPNIAVGASAVVTWDMSTVTAGGTDWIDNTVTRLWIDLGSTTADIFEIDWIAVGSEAPAVGTAALRAETQARVDAIGAEATARNELAARVTTAEGNISSANAAITSEATTRANADSALSARIDTLSAQAGNKTYRQAAAPASGMIAGDLWFDTANDNKPYRYSGSAWVATDDTRISTALSAIQTEQTARANADTAIAKDVTTLTARIDLVAFREVFAGTIADFNANWTSLSGTGELTIVASGGETGTNYLQVGNNASPDSRWLIGSRNIPFDPNRLYKITARVRRPLGSGAFSLGFVGIAADGATKVSASGTSTATATDHFVAANSSTAIDTGWTTVTGYLKGFAAAGASGTSVPRSDPTSPGTLYYGASGASAPVIQFIRPVMSCNWTAIGQTDIDLVTIEYADMDAAIQVESTARANKFGEVEAKYAVKVDVNGYVSGFGLISTANNATPTSDFIVSADRFSVAKPGTGGLAAPVVPFIVSTKGSTPVLSFAGYASIDRLLSGTIDTETLYVGGTNVILDGPSRAIRISNGTRDLVKMGQLSTGVFGIEIKDAAGNIILSSGSGVPASKISGLGALATKDTIAASDLSFGVGTNRLYNGEFNVSIDGWGTSDNSTGRVLTMGRNVDANNTIPGIGLMWFTAQGTPAAGSAFLTRNEGQTGQRYPVVGGARYEAHALCGLWRASYIHVSLYWYNSSGTFLSSSHGSQVNKTGPFTKLGDLRQSYVIATAPATATTVSVRLWVQTNGQADPYGVATQVYFGGATASQTEASPYVPGPQPLAYTSVQGLGPLANAIDMNSARNTLGLGSLATLSSVDWSTVTGKTGFAALSQITKANASTYIANAAFNTAHVEYLSASVLASGTLLASTQINVGTGVQILGNEGAIRIMDSRYNPMRERVYIGHRPNDDFGFWLWDVDGTPIFASNGANKGLNGTYIRDLTVGRLKIVDGAINGVKIEDLSASNTVGNSAAGPTSVSIVTVGRPVNIVAAITMGASGTVGTQTSAVILRRTSATAGTGDVDTSYIQTYGESMSATHRHVLAGVDYPGAGTHTYSIVSSIGAVQRATIHVTECRK